MPASFRHRAPEGDDRVAGRVGRSHFRQESLSALTSEAAAIDRPGVHEQSR